jgi:hypothetical protein
MMLRYVGRSRKFGPTIVDRGVLFQLRAPKLGAVSLALEGNPLVPMTQKADGWHEVTLE